MNKTKRVLSVVLAVLMLSSLIAALAIADGQHTVIINYVFENGKQAAPSWTATLAEGSSLEQTVTSPTVVGYEPDPATVNVTVNNITENKNYTVTYYPANVGFTVNHYLQNVADNNYTLDKTEHVGGYTESEVGGDLAKAYPGFAALLYNTKAKVAADGSTVVEIYYDRNYYMMSFNLDGGYGVEPIYARYGAAITLGEPTKPGYKFDGWTPKLPTTMPVGGGTYAAKWTKQDSKYQIQYWQENADDDGYSYVESETVTAATGDVVNYNGNKSYVGFTRNTDKTDKNVTVNGDGSTVLNVYFNRNVYEVKFYKNDGSNRKPKWSEINSLRITAKYGANIRNQWPTYSGSNTWSVNGTYTWNLFDGYVKDGPYQANIDTMPLNGATFYGPLTSESSETAYYYVEVLPGEEGTEHGSILYKEHHRDTSAGSGFSITDEDKYPITGFTFKEVKTKSGSGNAYDGATFYYTRNRNKLVFDDQYGTKVTEELPFEQVLSESVNYKNNYQPAYPSTLEAGAYMFDGWYLDPGCTQPVDWTAKMPDAQVVVYAKWAPKTHAVNAYLTKEVVGGEAIYTYHVPHGTAVPSAPANPTHGNYTFVGWFYMDGNVEKAFDFSMPIVKDLNLYAKWSSNTLVAYTIKYTLENGTVIADETTGSALAGTTLTFEAKTGDELNEGYQRGYFPHTGSHSLTMDINGNNEFTFVYVAKAKVGYTVRYLDKATGEPVVVNGVPTPDKTGETSDAIITEKFKVITGYMPDSYQKRLVLSATEAENVITFWYTKDEHHATIQKNYWIQNVDGNGYSSMPYSEISAVGNIGTTYSADVITITGFIYNANPTNAHTEHPALASGVLTANGLELNMYYDRNTIEYTVKHVDANTNETIESKTGSALFGAQVIGNEGTFDGYMPIEDQPKQKSIIIGMGTNEIIFYYYPCYYIGHVRSGRLNNTDTIRLTGSPENLTARVPQGYLYGGAFTNEACDADHVQTFTQGENAINFTPVKGETYYIWEVSETYLKPRAYAVWRHDPAHNGAKNVVGLYLTTSVDRNMYQQVGFAMENNVDILSTDGNVYTKVRTVYESGEVKEEMYVESNGDLTVTQTAMNEGKYGYVGIARKETNNIAQSFNYRPYWVTLDGIRVTSAYAARNCGYQGPGYEELIMSELVKASSNVSVYASNSTRTVGVEGIALLSAVTENAAAPEVPETPVIPEIPEAPEMTLNSDAMYLRAQYTYEMMTNTVKFISAIDVNECIEYGFVINGEVVKCEEAAQTVDGYDANYLFGGSVNGAMLMSCNMLLDGLVDGMPLNVTPYYVALDGTTVYGETRPLVYRQWVGLEG